MLNQLNIEGKTKVEIAIERLKQFQPSEGYYIGISGGKDSDVIVKLAELAEVKYDLHHQLTGMDAPQTVYYIKSHYPNVKIDYPKKSMWQLIIENGFPPTRLMRYCCKNLKEYGGEGRFKVLGIRWQESSKRKKNRKLIETGITKNNCRVTGTKVLNPIIDWTSSDIWEFHKEFKLLHNPLYDMGYTRIGCIMCPQKGKSAILKDAEIFPKYYEQFIRTFNKMLLERQKRGLKTTWKDGEDVMNWWVNMC